MENTNRTELVFILDRSGSMSGLEADTIGGFNSMLARQKEEPGEVTVTTVLFDDRYELLHDRMDLRAVAPITNREYYVRGCTALLDAMGRTIQKIANVQRRSAPEHRADKVLFVITTDGMENASREYNYNQIRTMVEGQKAEFGWDFLFLGANIDAIATARRFGIREDRAVNYHADGQGTRLLYRTVGEVITNVRCAAPMSADWKADMEEDFRNRKADRS